MASNAAPVAFVALFVAVVLQGCGFWGHEDMVRTLCAASTGHALSDLRGQMLESLRAHCADVTANTTTEGSFAEPACEHQGQLEVDAEVYAEQENLTQQCVDEWANTSMANLIDLDFLTNFTHSFVDHHSDLLGNFTRGATERATLIVDAAQAYANISAAVRDAAGAFEGTAPIAQTPSEPQPSQLYSSRNKKSNADGLFPAKFVLATLISAIAAVGMAGALVVRVSRYSLNGRIERVFENDEEAASAEEHSRLLEGF